MLTEAPAAWDLCPACGLCPVCGILQCAATFYSSDGKEEKPWLAPLCSRSQSPVSGEFSRPRSEEAASVGLCRVAPKAANVEPAGEQLPLI